MAQRATDKVKGKKMAVSNKKLPSEVSLQKVIEASKLLAKGKSRQYVIDYAKEHYGVCESQAKRYYSAAVRMLLPDDMEEFRKGLIQANIERLEHIIEKAMELGQYKIAREAIDSLNKMLGLNSGLQIGVQTDNDNNTQQIFIKFDQ